MSELKFNSEQWSVINKLNSKIDLEKIERIFSNSKLENLELSLLINVLEISNALYRSGYPVITDMEYDKLLDELKNIDPSNPYLTTIEPELLADSKMVPLPQKMLSTDKAYSLNEIKKWIERILKAGEEIGIDSNEVKVRVTPKLDGYAAFDDGKTLYTRGDGDKGQDITRAFDRGLKVAKNGERGLGPGEIVVRKSYFDDVLSQYFENSRNIQAAIIAEKKVDENVQKAIKKGACIFYPFSLVSHWTGLHQELLSDFDNIIEQIWNAEDYDVDGVVLEATNESIKNYMGANRKFHKWQIAYKINDESADVEVLDVTPQTSRTGRVTPVAELKPTKLSGATLSRATVHHYKMVKKNGVGPGAIVKLVRSGLVIPKIVEVVKRTEPKIPEYCPSCNSSLEWKGDNLLCNNTSCPARKENSLIHYFKTLGNIDGFGPKVIEKLHLYGIDHIHQVYALPRHKFMSFGFGDKTSRNLVDQLNASREIEVEDSRFLAAFGVGRLGAANCEKLLQHHVLLDLFKLSADEMVKIDGFAQLSAEVIVEGLKDVKEEFFKVYELGFNLVQTQLLSGTDSNSSPISGKVIVFTGTMIHGKRDEMKKKAKSLGAKVGTSVSGSTDYLVAGEKVGAKKIQDAKDKGVQVLSEGEYLELLQS